MNTQIILNPSNMHGAFDPNGLDVYCDFAGKPAVTNSGFCQYCGSTTHEPISATETGTDQIARWEAEETARLSTRPNERAWWTLVDELRAVHAKRGAGSAAGIMATVLQIEAIKAAEASGTPRLSEAYYAVGVAAWVAHKA